MQLDCNAEFINLLNLAMIPEESTVVDFTCELFKRTGYVHRHRVAQIRKDLPLFICGEWRHAKTNVCIEDLHQNDILLVVQEETRLKYRKPGDVSTQLVAEAMAAFTVNNAKREGMGLPPLDSKVSHAGNHHGWHFANVLQDPYHQRTYVSYSAWNIPSNPYHRHLLFTRYTTPRSPLQ
ncbi:hypothetical protein BJ165DRAFT_1337358 [Panaeolus papilionaceus]|nr:hypothetical protein BJ165DRAFT_1337358 [Panaeolus papilionaceus]